MAHVTLSTLTYHLQGYLELELDPASDFLTRTRRLTRTPTLDGGVEIEDGGFAHGDLTFRLVASVTRAQLDQLRFLLETFPLLLCSIPEGLFRVAPQGLAYAAGKATLTLWALRREV